MWGEMERSPALAAPGSNNYAGLIASSTVKKSGREGDKRQVLSDEDANSLCEQYAPLVRRIARGYQGRGIAYEELESAGLAGLVLASRRCDPARGAFGSYVGYYIQGGILDCFKPGKDALGFGRSESLNVPVFQDESESAQAVDCVVDETPPPLTGDLGCLTEREQRIVLGRVGGDSLREIGRALGVSGERVRQIATKAHGKLRKANIRKTKENYPLRVAPRDHEARRFRDEYLGCNGKAGPLLRRRGYRKPSRQLLPFKSVTYPCRSLSKAEIEPYERGEL